MTHPAAVGQDGFMAVPEKKEPAWQNRIVDLAYMKPGDIRPNEKNWRTHPDSQRGALSDVLSRVGLVMPVLYNKRTERLIDGHLRQDMAGGEQELPVIIVDLDEQEEALVLASLDPLAAMAGQDDEALAALVEDVDVGEGALGELLGSMVEEVPDFQPVGEDEQSRLDQKKPVQCPECGHEFTT